MKPWRKNGSDTKKLSQDETKPRWITALQGQLAYHRIRLARELSNFEFADAARHRAPRLPQGFAASRLQLIPE